MALEKLMDFLTQFDYFGVVFNFNYLSQEKYRSATGGISFIIFSLLAITYGIITAVPLLKRENMSIIYYTMQTFETDAMNFKKFSTNFAAGVATCYSLKNIDDFWKYFTLQVNHIRSVKEDGKIVKYKTVVPTRLCNYGDFYNNMNESFDFIGLDKFYCPVEQNYTIQGKYNDPIFEYFEISVLAKDDSDETVNMIKTVLSSECNFNLYYVDVGFDLYSYSSPERPFLTTQFATIKFEEIVKTNLFYKVQQFDSYQNYFFDTSKRKELIGFDSFETYSIHKGEKRFSEKTSDYNLFYKAYLRAALKRNIIERKYMKLTEYAANVSSILSTILLIMFVCLTFINKFYAYEAVMKKIFLFSNFSDNKDKRVIKSHLKHLLSKNMLMGEEFESSKKYF